MKKQQGFTLIELVVVIIILGILAVTAAPKFINLQGDARASALQGLKGAIQGANSLVYSKAALLGQEKGDASVKVDDTSTVAILNGYMKATKASLEAGMDITFDDASSQTAVKADWIIDSKTGTPGTAKIYQHGAPAECYFTYTEAKAAAGSEPATSAKLPTYVITDTGC